MKGLKGGILKFVLTSFLFLGLRCSTSEETADEIYPAPPDWAPYYETYNSRFFYIPDIAIYYDNFSRDFIYWDGFTWVRSPWLPDMYGSYNLHNSYIVILDSRINNPWYYHNHYLNEYPRNYYYGPRSSPHRAKQPARGYNENDRKLIAPRNNRTRPSTTPIPRIEEPRKNINPVPAQPNIRQPGIDPTPQQPKPEMRPPVKEAPREVRANATT